MRLATYWHVSSELVGLSRAPRCYDQHKIYDPLIIPTRSQHLRDMATITEVGDTLVTAAHSFKPYARSLSHELRTPMHGVIGMLDVMHATVQEAIESQQNHKIRSIFQALRENIEVVQGRNASSFLPWNYANCEQTVLDEQLRQQTTLSTPMS